MGRVFAISLLLLGVIWAVGYSYDYWVPVVDTSIAIGLVVPSMGTGWAVDASQLSTIGYVFDTLPNTSGIGTLMEYDVIILPNCWGYYLTDFNTFESHADDYKEYVREGGYLIIEQTNPFSGFSIEEVLPELVPCTFKMKNRYSAADHGVDLLRPEHPLFDGVGPSDYHRAADTDTLIPSSWEVLAVNVPSENPAILTTHYGDGYILRHSMVPSSISDAAVINIIEWDGSGCRTLCLEDVECEIPGVWPQFHFDAQNRGLSPYICPCDSANVRVLWTFMTGGAVQSSPALDENCILYIGSNDSNLYALNVTGGELLWVYHTGGSIGYSSPALGPDGSVYIAASDGYLYAIDHSGALTWSYLTRFDVGGVKGSPTIDYSLSRVYVCSDHTNSPWAGWLTCLGLDGTFYWEAYPPISGSWISTTPAVDEESFILTTDWANTPGGLTLWSTSGIDQWTWASSSVIGEMDIMSCPAVDDSRDRVYFGGNKFAANPTAQKIFAVDYSGATSTLAWEVNIASDVQYSTAAIGPDGAVYIGANNGNVYAFEPDGTIRWTFLTGGAVRSSPVVDSNSVVYVGSADNNLYAINPDGTERWHVTTEGPVNSSAAIGPDGIIFFGSNDGNIYAVGCHTPGWCDAAPEGQIIEPLPYTITACPEQPIRILLTCSLPLDTASIILGVNTDMYLYPDQLVLQGDTLIFTPDASWDNGDEPEVSLLRADNINGTPLDSIITWLFTVDLEPPLAQYPEPPGGSILGELPEMITIELYDEISGIEPGSIQLSINGMFFDLTSPALHWNNDTLSFFPYSAESLLLADSMLLTIFGAYDSPDYCEPNLMEPFSWVYYLDYMQAWFRDTIAFPGDTILIPVWIDEPSRFRIADFDFEFFFFPEILHVLAIENEGTASEDWETLLFDTPEDGHTVVSGSGSGFLTSNEVICYIKVAILPTAVQGGYSPLNFGTFTLNEGSLTCQTENALLLINWLPLEWLFELEVTGASSRKKEVLVIGTSGSGTDGYDPGADIIALPPTESIDAYFPMDDEAFPHIRKLQRDIRYYMGFPICWTIVLEGESGMISWNPEYLPSGMFLLDGYLNMSLQTQHYFREGDTVEVCFDRPRPGAGTIEFCTGWNLVSFYALPQSSDLTSIFPDIIPNFFGYEPLTRSYQSYSELQAGRGYWVYSLRDTIVRFGGIAIENYYSLLDQGWNLVGSVNAAVPVINISGRIETPLYFWNCSAYEPTDSITPGMGCWVLVSATACTLEVSGAEGAALFYRELIPASSMNYGHYPPGPPSGQGYLTDPLPRKFSVKIYPNPFNIQVSISLALSETDNVVIEIFDLHGKTVYSVQWNNLDPGFYDLTWEGVDNQQR
ncbi:PQQ-binding-like beta-propeller repeat protein, partial [bacterium]|nr:PQQ-binding-like beta-propeller repeat protein [bacterium]